MNKIITQQANIAPLEENFINWSKVQNDLQNIFGKEVYESWIKKVSLTKELNNYVVLCTPTKFVRDWIASRYADKILDLLKKHKKTIDRIEFVISNEISNESLKNKTFEKKSSLNRRFCIKL